VFDISKNLHAHVTEVVPTVPTIHVGDVVFAAIGLIVSIIAMIAIYRFLDKLPHKSGNFSEKKETFLARFVVSMILIGVSATAWDIWWHRAVGRDSMFELPHLFLYSSALLAVIGGVYGFYKTRHKIWKKVAIAMLVVPITAPFDNFWHLFFGVEDLSRPVSMSWSPPHATLSITILLALVFLIPIIIRTKHSGLRHFFGTIAFGSIMGILMFLLLPIHPTEGMGQLLGFWGAGILAAFLAGTYMSAQKWLGGKVDAIRAGLVTILLGLLFIGEETAPGIIILPHDKPPTWLFIVAHFIPLVFLDLMKDRIKPPIRGAIAGAIYTFLLFGFSRVYFEAQFQYGNIDVAIAVIAGIIGGFIAGLAVSKKKLVK
jgi:hypothetical protein